MRLIYDSSAAISDYNDSPAWFKKLLDAAADGVNYYLSKHPGKAKVLKHFEPWYALMRTDGSISATSTGGITVSDVKAFYTGKQTSFRYHDNPAISENVSGSNGFAIAGSKTVSHNAMLYINPHVTFYFRDEMQMVSEEGLNAYGAVTWGQFFIYQGFNQHCGWMHTSSQADVADVYKEKISGNKDLFYLYNDTLRPVVTKSIEIRYKSGSGFLNFAFQGYYTHHGPVLAGNQNEWLAVKEYNRSLKALMQSWLRTKANTYSEFETVMDMRANTSNNTVYADDQGNIGYWHGDFMPVRDTSINWALPVDGTISATEWRGVHPLRDIVQVHNPVTGWIQNCNSTPFTVSGISSPLKSNFPTYMAPDGENPRAINAIRLLGKEDHFTLDKLISVGYNTHLSAFDILLPSLFKAYDADGSTLHEVLKDAVNELRTWNREATENSVATTLAIEWGTMMNTKLGLARMKGQSDNAVGFLESLAQNVAARDQLTALQFVLNKLENNFGTWKVKWGTLNRYQRVDFDLGEHFADKKPSMPAGAASSQWGCLPSFSTVYSDGNKLRYGVNGNSFVAAVEFGKKVRAKTIITGGQGTTSASKHFLDQADMYLHGKFKEVWFYKTDVVKHIERNYHP